MQAFLSTTYFGPVQWYQKLCRCSTVYMERCDSYRKQTYRNRCVIAAANGPQVLTVPVERPSGSGKLLTRDVRISDHGNWRHLHWNALCSAYRHSPFFDYYADDFRPFYEQRYTFLYDFNEALCALVCSLIDMQPHIVRTDEYRQTFGPDEADVRELIHPKHPCTDDPDFRPVPYYQVFSARHGFLPNLSIVDLLFNMGPESLLVLRDSIVTGTRTAADKRTNKSTEP